MGKIACIFAAGCIWLCMAKWVMTPTDGPPERVQVDTGRQGPTKHDFWANISAYCPCERCCGKYADGITADGTRLGPNSKGCAADKRWPYGTLMEIPGYGNVPVFDRGGAIKGNKLDVFFDSHEDALQWGRRQLLVTVTPRDP